MYQLFQVIKTKFDPKVLVINLAKVGRVAKDVVEIKKDLGITKDAILETEAELEELREDVDRNDVEIASIRMATKAAEEQAARAEVLALEALKKTSLVLKQNEEVEVGAKRAKLALAEVQKKNLELELDLVLLKNKSIAKGIELIEQELKNLEVHLFLLRAMGRDRRSFINEMSLYKDKINDHKLCLKSFYAISEDQIKQMDDLIFKLNHQ
jgi:chromosome segregation ATPase